MFSSKHYFYASVIAFSSKQVPSTIAKRAPRFLRAIRSVIEMLIKLSTSIALYYFFLDAHLVNAALVDVDERKIEKQFYFWRYIKRDAQYSKFGERISVSYRPMPPLRKSTQSVYWFFQEYET